ncbi:MAG: hypothetical protein AAGA48_00150 [Myxococcota bacterium]
MNRWTMALLMTAACDSGVDFSTCEELTDAQFVGGLVLEEGSCWRVEEPLNLSDGTVTIEPGVSIGIAADLGVRVQPGGMLRMAGTEEEPVTWTTGDPLIGWTGIQVLGAGSDNAWEHATIEYAGSDRWNGATWSAGAVFLDGNASLTLENVTIRGSAGHGLIATSDVQLATQNLVFEANDTPAFVHPDVAGNLTASFIENTNPYVRVGFSNNDVVIQDQTWAALGVPWRIEDRFYVEGAMALEPGTTLEFSQGASLRIQTGGSLDAQGTETNPIVFRGTSSMRGFWQGIAVASDGGAIGAGIVLQHAEIADAGSDDWNGRNGTSAALWLNSASTASVTQTTFRRHDRYGVWASDEASLARFGDNRFVDGGRAMFLHPDRVGELDGTSVIEENDLNRIDVVHGNTDSVTFDATWRDLGVPYAIRDRFYIEADVTIEPGVVIEVQQDTSIIVDDDGRFDAMGTADRPVTVQGAEERTGGFWTGIQFAGGALSTLNHTVLRDTGANRFTGDGESAAALFLTAIANVSLNDVTIGPGGGYGIYLADEDSALSCGQVGFSNLDAGAVYDRATGAVLPGC